MDKEILNDVPIDDIKPYGRNPRKNDGLPVEEVAKSLQKVGYRTPIIVDEDNVIICGHTRWKAIKQIGWDKIPFVVKYTDLTADQKKQYRVLDNKTGEFAEWDFDVLTQDFEQEELLEMGFDVKDLPQEEVIEDEAPPVPETPRTVKGDIYQLGNHRVMCGDSTIITDVEKLMDGVYPDLIHTDPPYGMNAVTKSGVLSKNYTTDIIGDDNPDIAKDAFRLINGLYKDAKQIWWGANYYCSVLPDSECWLVWDKDNGQSDQTDCELAWANFRSVVRQFTQSSEKTNRVHPTQKPVSLMAWIIKRFNLSAKTIADFFGGSGSTLIAAEKHNIASFIMEFDPKFCDVIVQRWVNLTGGKVILNGNEVEWHKTEVKQ